TTSGPALQTVTFEREGARRRPLLATDVREPETLAEALRVVDLDGGGQPDDGIAADPGPLRVQPLRPGRRLVAAAPEAVLESGRGAAQATERPRSRNLLLQQRHHRPEAEHVHRVVAVLARHPAVEREPQRAGETENPRLLHPQL